MTKYYYIEPSLLKLVRKATPHSALEYMEVGEGLIVWLKENPEFNRQQVKLARMLKISKRRLQRRLYVSNWPKKAKNFIRMYPESFSQTALDNFADKNSEWYGKRFATGKNGKKLKRQEKYTKTDKLLNALKRHVNKDPNPIRVRIPTTNLQSPEIARIEDLIRDKLKIKTIVTEQPGMIVLAYHEKEQLYRIYEEICH